jgi:Interferon-induced transmembrane protein/Type IV pilin-like G and H, putative
MTTTPRPNALTAAQQGNPNAIALLLNQALKPHGQTAKVIRHESALRILVEGKTAPDEATIGPLIETGLRQLGLAEITPTIQLYGQLLGQSVPAWTRSINLALDNTAAAIFSFDPVPEVTPPPTQLPIVPPPRSSPPPASVRSVVSDPPPKPPSYTGLTIVAFLIGVFPLNWVMLHHASQISKYYKQGDYDGAEIASAQTKLWCQINLGLGIPICLIIAAVVLLDGAGGKAKVRPTAPEQAAILRLQAMMEAERKFWVETDKFSPTITMPADNSSAAMVDPYRYQVTLLDSQRVQVTAIPTRKGLHSFTAGMLMAGPADDIGPESVICRSEKPSTKAVLMPIVAQGRIPVCPPQAKIVLSSLGMVEDAFTPQEAIPEEPLE